MESLAEELVGSGEGSSLHFAIYSQKIPCNPCYSSFDGYLHDMAVQVAIAAGFDPSEENQLPVGVGCGIDGENKPVNPATYWVTLSVLCYKLAELLSK